MHYTEILKRERRRHRGVIFQERNDRELVNLVPYAKAKGGFLVAATANKESQLAVVRHARDDSSTGELQPFEKGSSSVGTSESSVTAGDVHGAADDVWRYVCGVYYAGERVNAG